ncbi:RNA-dependent RNA polymerase [viral metagenome]|uniref:RNA-dependent RNA polymerase n=1 Tax=viral metagenome TaxID=1070528 RepID=A0A6L2ZJ94_9ZZZZ
MTIKTDTRIANPSAIAYLLDLMDKMCTGLNSDTRKRVLHSTAILVGQHKLKDAIVNFIDHLVLTRSLRYDILRSEYERVKRGNNGIELCVVVLLLYYISGIGLDNDLWQYLNVIPLYDQMIRKLKLDMKPASYIKWRNERKCFVGYYEDRFKSIDSLVREIYGRDAIINDQMIERVFSIYSGDISDGRFSNTAGDAIDIVRYHGMHRDAASLNTFYKRASGRAAMKQQLDIKDVYKLCVSLNKENTFWNFFENVPIECDWTNAALAGYILASVLNPSYNEDVDSIIKMALQVPMIVAVEHLNNYHALIRATMKSSTNEVLSDIDYCRMQYFNVLVNRSEDFPFSARDEIMMRAVRGPAQGVLRLDDAGRIYNDSANYLKDVKRATIELFDTIDIKPVMPNIGTFADYWRRRLKTVAGGSAPGYTLKLKKDGKVYTIRSTKRLAMEFLTYEELNDVLMAVDPVLHSRSAQKLEPGKTRAIWNSSLEHYFIMAYIADTIENMLYKAPWCSAYENIFGTIHNEQTRLDEIKKLLALFMWDYADFNIAHLLLVMIIMWQTMCDHILAHTKDPTVRRDVLRARRYLTLSTLNTIMEDQDSGLIMLVVRSLMTGMRGTSLVNTVLNRVYSLLLAQSLYNLHLDVKIINNYCSGDDVWNTLSKNGYACILSIILNLMGFAGKPIKVLANRGEFLRRAYLPTGQYGFLNRLLANMVAGEFSENLGLHDPYGRARAIIDLMNEYKMRGGNLTAAPALTKLLIFKLTRLKYRIDGVTKIYVPDMRLFEIPTWRGGLGITYKAQKGNKALHVIAKLPNPTLRLDHTIISQYIGVATNECIQTMHRFRLFKQDITLIADEIVSAGAMRNYPTVLKSDLLQRLGEQLSKREEQIRNNGLVWRRINDPIKFVIADDARRAALLLLNAIKNSRVIYGLWGVANMLTYVSPLPTLSAFKAFIKTLPERQRFRDKLLYTIELLSITSFLKDNSHLIKIIRLIECMNWPDKTLKAHIYGEIPYNNNEWAGKLNLTVSSAVRVAVMNHIESEYNGRSSMTIQELQYNVYLLENMTLAYLYDLGANIFY